MQRFQLRYSAVEDRIIVSIEDDAAGLTEFALTRRLVRRLWPGRAGARGAGPRPGPAGDAPARAGSAAGVIDITADSRSRMKH